MFEDSTFESQGRITTSSRRWSLAAFALNSSMLAALVIFPLIHSEAIPHRFIDIAIAPPPAAHAPDPVQAHPRTAVLHGRPELTPPGLQTPRVIPIGIHHGSIAETAAPMGTVPGMDAGGSGTGIPGGDIFRSAPPHPVQPKPNGPVPISQGVAAGMVLYKTIPTYPAIARAAHVEGTVILHAVIAKGGQIQNLRVESGPAMLQQAALDAVAQWRYRPYLLNGAPVEVETTINVVFSLGR